METATLNPPTKVTAEQPAMTVRSSLFGTIKVEARHIFTFPKGLHGFDELRSFIIIRDERTEPVRWLLSIEQPELCFPVMSPYLLVPDYYAGKEYADTARYTPLVILVLGAAGPVANLKAPIILDVPQQRGEQIIISSERYPTDYPVAVPQPTQK